MVHDVWGSCGSECLANIGGSPTRFKPRAVA
jgi:hypothetical protein